MTHNTFWIVVRERWYDDLWSVICVDGGVMPDVGIHGFSVQRMKTDHVLSVETTDATNKLKMKYIKIKIYQVMGNHSLSNYICIQYPYPNIQTSIHFPIAMTIKFWLVYYSFGENPSLQCCPGQTNHGKYARCCFEKMFLFVILPFPTLKQSQSTYILFDLPIVEKNMLVAAAWSSLLSYWKQHSCMPPLPCACIH